MAKTDLAAEIAAKGYAHGEKLVSTAWLAAHLDDPLLRILESDEDVLLYDMGHIPGAQKIDWHTDLNDPVQRDYVSSAQFQELLRARGIDDATPVILYGDKSNWWAAYALWVFELFGFTNARLLDGGRAKWEAEGRPMVTDRPRLAPSAYWAPPRNDERIHAFMADVLVHQRAKGAMIDVRSLPEYTGERSIQYIGAPSAWTRISSPSTAAPSSACCRHLRRCAVSAALPVRVPQTSQMPNELCRTIRTVPR